VPDLLLFKCGRRLGVEVDGCAVAHRLDAHCANEPAYFDFYNRRRIHQSHEYQTPDEIYYATTAGEPLAIAA
jgi:hypothetical protein